LDNLWIEAFRYHKWANLHLLDVCSKLPDEQLRLTAPGTYGTIATTLHHLVAAEQRYIARLTGRAQETNERDEFPGVAKLTALASDSADRLIESAGRVKPDDVTELKRDVGTFKLHLGIVIIQALHHGNDHRTHICTILGHHDIPYGGMDVWAYGEAIGAIVPTGSNG
jgi:uncharacterized damage-inducible protein DinB